MIKRQLLKKKLSNISKGDVDVEYRMKFPVVNNAKGMRK
jgi:peptide deformylase